MAVNNIRRNPFWEVIVKELDAHGYKLYDSAYHQSDYKVVIQGCDADGRHVTQEYIFARVCRSIRAVHNFRADFRRFLRIDLPNRQFRPRDHHTRQPGMFVQKIQRDAPKKPLATPLPMQRQLAEGTLPGILVYPTMPTTYTGDRVISAKQKLEEPLSTTKSIAAFLVDNADLSTLLELMNGLATLRGVKPAPLRITGETEAVTVYKPLPAPTVTPTPVPVEQNSNVIHMPVTGMSDKIIQRLSTAPGAVFTVEDLKDIASNRKSLVAALSKLVTSDKIAKVGHGKFKKKA